MEEVGVDAHAAAPEAVGGGRRWEDFLLGVVRSGVVGVGVEGVVARETDGDGDDGLEALGRGEVGHCVVGVYFARGVEEEHAEADERVAEEDGDAEEEQDKEDVDFLADVFVCEGDGEVCGVVRYGLIVVVRWGTYKL